MSGPTEQQKERAIEAAVNRTDDPLKNWTRLQNEECPICMLPLPWDPSEIIYCVTCGKTVCMGCVISTGVAHARDGGDMEKAAEKAITCPYCRSNPASYDDKSQLKALMKLANTGNGEAMRRIGRYYFKGEMGLQQDKAEGLKWYHRAVEAGSGRAAYGLGRCFNEGDGVDRNDDKALEYLQKSTELGCIPSFVKVGIILQRKGEIEKAMLNYRKAVMCGVSNDNLFNEIRIGFRNGHITKDEYAFTLRESQKACNEMKSETRDFVMCHQPKH